MKKLNNKNGFSLAETLVAILILLMVSGLMAGGIPVAFNTYRKAVNAANAQVYMSTTMTAIRDELDCAKDVRIDSTSITYTDASGYQCTMKLLNDQNKGIYIVKKNPFNNKYANLQSGSYSDSEVSNPLVSRSASENRYYATYENVSISDNIITFVNLKTIDKESNSVVDVGNYKVLIINAG